MIKSIGLSIILIGILKLFRWSPRQTEPITIIFKLTYFKVLIISYSRQEKFVMESIIYMRNTAVGGFR